MEPTDRPVSRPVTRREHRNGGWGFAILIIALAVIINSAVTYYHYTTSARSPQDVMFRAKGEGAER
jgi:hypothetical protein